MKYIHCYTGKNKLSITITEFEEEIMIEVANSECACRDKMSAI